MTLIIAYYARTFVFYSKTRSATMADSVIIKYSFYSVSINISNSTRSADSIMVFIQIRNAFYVFYNHQNRIATYFMFYRII